MDATRPLPDRPSNDDAPQVVVRSGGRVRATLRCPYCHDQVGRQGALACARRGCGALYHRECWEECARWDGCAALACGSREAREVSALGYLVRLLRLVLAAMLFPRRVLGALGANENASPTQVLCAAWRAAWAVLPTQDTWKANLVSFAYVVVSLALIFGNVVLLVRYDRWNPTLTRYVLAPVTLLLLTLGVPFLLTLVLAICFYALRALALAFRVELAAFGRQEAVVRTDRSAPKKDG